MDNMSSGEAAAQLGCSIPTVRRAAHRLGLGTTSAGGHLRLTNDDLCVLEQDLGRVPKVDGLRRTEVQVLAALALSPLGLRSVRAVARVASLSATAAGRALEDLVDKDLVLSERRMLAEGGAVEGEVWRLRLDEPWWRVVDVVATTVLPRRTAGPGPDRLPRHLRHLFWNADPEALDLDDDAAFIATRLVLGDDLQGLAWACSHLPVDALRRAAGNRGADPATRALVDNVVAARAA